MLTPPHVHSAEEEIFHVLSGSATLWQDGSTCTVAEGDTLVFNASGPTHTLIGGGDGFDVLIFGQRLAPESGVLPRTNVAWLAHSPVQVMTAHPWDAEAALGIPDGTPGRAPVERDRARRRRGRLRRHRERARPRGRRQAHRAQPRRAAAERRGRAAALPHRR